ncbi:hypothetical protein BSKO_02761 [Bryopsis sp. KO-2023]|nr:hypothetical protein BSKO_02761 [Bryopsis sp. KO-2023]
MPKWLRRHQGQDRGKDFVGGVTVEQIQVRTPSEHSMPEDARLNPSAPAKEVEKALAGFLHWFSNKSG